MSAKENRIHGLLYAIIQFLEAQRSVETCVEQVLAKLSEMDTGTNQQINLSPVASRHDRVLSTAITGIKAPELRNIADCLVAARDDLVWQEDQDEYYLPGTDLGDGYRKCNLHTSLIGPNGCGYHHPDFNLGIFMLGPQTLYRDHSHAAPELYVTLSEKTGWRFDCATWKDYPAGSVFWNKPGDRHAIRVYKQPFISIFVWLENVRSPCCVIPMDDWTEIEAALRSNT